MYARCAHTRTHTRTNTHGRTHTHTHVHTPNTHRQMTHNVTCHHTQKQRFRQLTLASLYVVFVCVCVRVFCSCAPVVFFSQETNLLGIKGPRKMTVLLPTETQDSRGGDEAGKKEKG